MTIRILTWNLQGRERPDLGSVSDTIRDASVDVALLQEVQRRQAQVIGRQLGWNVSWRFKHWPVVFRAEGLAVLSPHLLTDTSRAVLAHGLAFWSWRRRIAVAAAVQTRGASLPVVNTHLGAAVGDAERARQARQVAAMIGPDGLLGGDLNTAPKSVVITVLEQAGLRDVWDLVRPGEPGPTNWPPGPRSGPPRQRLDYLFASDAWRAVDADVPAFGDPGFELFGALSDHLPLIATLERR